MIAAFLTLIPVVVLVMYLVVPQLASCVQMLLAELPAAVRSVVAWGQQHGVIPENVLEALDQIDWRERIDQIVDVLMTTAFVLPKNVRGIIADCGFTSAQDIWRHVVQKNIHQIYNGLRSTIADTLCRDGLALVPTTATP